MSDYALARSRSSALVRCDSRPTVLLSRTYSVPDVTSYIRASDRYKPTWPSYYSLSSTYPYRYYRNHSLYDDYWYDKYHYFSPLYYSSLSPRRYYYSDHIANPYYWSTPNYWTRYKNYTYGYGYPYTYRRYGDPYYESYLSPYYRPYRSHLLDNYGHIKRPDDQWDQSYKNLKQLHYWHNQSSYLPSYYNRNARNYQTEWAQ